MENLVEGVVKKQKKICINYKTKETTFLNYFFIYEIYI